MSYDFSVYARANLIPTVVDFTTRLREAGGLSVDDRRPLLQLGGFLPVTFEGRQSGFEVMIFDVTPDDREEARRDYEAAGEPDDGYLEALDNSDVQFTLLCRDVTQIAAARVFARTLALAVNGYFSDPQTGEFERLG